MESTDKEDELMHHLRRPLIENSQKTYPWLVISHGKKNQMLTFYNVSEDRYYKRTIPDMRNKHLLGIHYGWLVLDDYTKDDTWRKFLNCYEKKSCSTRGVILEGESRKVIFAFVKCEFSDLAYHKCEASL